MKPLIIAHRVNTVEKLRTVPREYGIEVDLRAEGDRIIMHHDPFQGGEDFEELLKEYNHQLAIFHLKETGIEPRIMELAKKYDIGDYFFHDMEPPLVFEHTRENALRQIAVRFSEAEPIELALAHKGLVNWVYLDVHTQLPLTPEAYEKLRQAGFKLCLTSPSLLGRPEDIEKYKQYMKKHSIEIDAVVEDIEHPENVNTWLS